MRRMVQKESSKGESGCTLEVTKVVWQENCRILGVMAGSEYLKTAELNSMVCVAHKCNVPV